MWHAIPFASICFLPFLLLHRFSIQALFRVIAFEPCHPRHMDLALTSLVSACVTWQYAQKAFLWALCGPIVQVCLVFAPSNLWHFLYFSNLLSFPWFVNLGWQRTVMGGHFSPALEPARQWRWFLNFVHWTSWLDSRNKFILGYSRWRTCTGNGSSWHYPLHALHWTLVCGLGWRVSCDCNLPCGSCTHPSLQENDNGQGQTLAVKGSF